MLCLPAIFPIKKNHVRERSCQNNDERNKLLGKKLTMNFYLLYFIWFNLKVYYLKLLERKMGTTLLISLASRENVK